MKFKIYDTDQNRYLSEEELEGQYFYTGKFDRNFEQTEYIEYFKINLTTGKLQTEFNIAFCNDPECCDGPDIIWTDTDRFIIEVVDEKKI